MSAIAVRACSVDGCDQPYYSTGMCRSHYDRSRYVPTARKVIPPAGRFWPKVDRRGPDECWPWLAGVSNDGYGHFFYDGQMGKAHRFAFDLVVGPIPEGLQLDHVCHTLDKDCPGGPSCPHRACVNPAHLEPVTNAENARRGTWARKHHCPRGHPYDAANTIWYRGSRYCMACRDLRNAATNAARKARQFHEAALLKPTTKSVSIAEERA